MSSSRLRKANPKCIINVAMPNLNIEPSIKIKCVRLPVERHAESRV